MESFIYLDVMEVMMTEMICLKSFSGLIKTYALTNVLTLMHKGTYF